MSSRACLGLLSALLLSVLPAGFAAEKTGKTDEEPLPAGAVARLGTNRLRPGGSVTRLAFSPDGRKIASWSSVLYVTDSLAIWDTRTGRLLRRVELPGARIAALMWLADGRGLAVVHTSGDARGPVLWEFTDEKTTPKIAPRMQGVVKAAAPNGAPADNEYDACRAISPDGKTLAIGRSGGRQDKPRPILLRPLKAGKFDEKTPAKELARQPGNCGEMRFTPDGKRLVVFNQAKMGEGNKLADNQLVAVWDVASGKEVARFTAPRPASNNGIALAVSNQHLALGLEDGATSLWDLTSGKERRIASDHVGKQKGQGYGTFAVAFSPDGKMLVTGGRDGLVKLWDTASGQNRHTLKRHHSWVEVVAASPDGRLVASAGQDGVIRLWDAASGADACPLPGHRFYVMRAVLSPDGRSAVTAAADGTLRWWDTTTGRERRCLDMPKPLMGLAISPDGKTALAAEYEGPLRTWELATGRETTPAGLPRDTQILAMEFTPDKRHLVAASRSRVLVWEWPSLKLARTLELPKPAKQPGENHCQSLAISPDSRWLVTAAERFWFREEKGLRFGYAADGVVDVWDLTSGKRVRRLVDGEGTFRSVTFATDGRLVLIGSGGTIPAEEGRAAYTFKGEMNLLDPLAARWLRSFTPPPRKPTVQVRYTGATALAPDGRSLYVSYNTGAIVVFEVATGQPRRALPGHREYVSTLSFSADGRRLLSGGRDSACLLWDESLASATKQRKEPLTAMEAEKLWQTASGTDAQAAFDALAELCTAPELALAVLHRQLKPVPAAPSEEELKEIFEQLDSNDFAGREKASRRLAAFGEAAVPGVRKRLGRVSSPEVRRRVQVFLERFDPREMTAARLRQLRGIELLEGIGDAAAKALLTELAHGAAGAPLTLDAAAALTRLERR